MPTNRDELLMAVLHSLFDGLSAVSADADYLRAEHWALLEASKDTPAGLRQKIEALRTEANYRSLLAVRESRLSTLRDMLGRLS